jgi:IS5 family transposase
MDRCWLHGALGDALHAISCAVGYNLRWLMGAVASLGLGAAFLRLLQGALLATRAMRACYAGRDRLQLSC